MWYICSDGLVSEKPFIPKMPCQANYSRVFASNIIEKLLEKKTL